MDKKTVYIETSVISYLTARPSSNLLAAAWQKATLDWWDTQRKRFSLYVSDIVIAEARCQVPDDYIGSKIGSLLRAREVMELLVATSLPENAQ